MRHVALALSVSLTVGSAAATSHAQKQASIFGLIVETATFADFQRTLGPADIRHNRGDAAASAYFACYVGVDGTALVLESNREMGGGTTVTAFQLLRGIELADFSGFEGYEPPSSARPPCARSAKLSQAVATGGGLRLGMKRAETVTLLRQLPTSAHAALFFVVGDRERPVREPDAGVIGYPSAWIVLDLEHDRVTGIRVAYSSAI